MQDVVKKCEEMQDLNLGRSKKKVDEMQDIDSGCSKKCEIMQDLNAGCMCLYGVIVSVLMLVIPFKQNVQNNIISTSI